MHDLRPPPSWKKPQTLADARVRRAGSSFCKRGLLATFQQVQQHKLAEYTLCEAEAALDRGDSEMACESFTRVLIQSAIAVENGVAGAAGCRTDAQKGAQRARLALVSTADATSSELEELSSYETTMVWKRGHKLSVSHAAGGVAVERLLAKAGELSGCNVSFASPPMDYPESPLGDAPTPPSHRAPASDTVGTSSPGDVSVSFSDVEVEPRQLGSAPRSLVQFSKQQPARRRELFAPKPLSGTSSDGAIATMAEEEVHQLEDRQRTGVTMLRTPGTQLAVLASKYISNPPIGMALTYFACVSRRWELPLQPEQLVPQHTLLAHRGWRGGDLTALPDPL